MIKIVEDGMEWTLKLTSRNRNCEECVHFGCCENSDIISSLCGYGYRVSFLEEYTTPVQDEAKVYHSANWKEAQHLIGTRVMYWDDKRFGGSWQYGTLQGILHTGNIYRMEEEDDNGAMITSQIIKKPEQRHLTFTQIKAMHPDLEDVVLIEGD